MIRPQLTLSPARNSGVVIAALAGFCLIYFSNPGIGISPDSVTYTSVARNLVDSGRPLEFDGEWLTDFPIGYPAFLGSIFFITRSDPFHFGLFLNSCLFGLLLYICLRAVKKNGFPIWLQGAYGLCLLSGTALLQVFGMLWSETLFILCIAFFFLSSGYYGRNHRLGPLFAMALATAIACVTRYAGVAVLATGLFLLIADRQLSRRKKALHALIYAGSAVAPLLINVLINRIHEGYLTGDRLVNQTPFTEHLQRFGTTLLRWIIPSFRGTGEGQGLLAAACTLGFIGAAAGAAISLWRRNKSLYAWAGLGAVFTAIYSVFLLGVAATTAFQPLDSRLLCPLWFPGLSAAAGGVLALSNRLRDKKKWTAFALWSTGLVVVFALSFPGIAAQTRLLAHPDQVYEDHIRYDFRAFDQSPTLHFVRNHPSLFKSDKPVYSNAGEVLYVLDSLQAGYPPRLIAGEEMNDFQSDSAYLIWLNNIHVYPEEYLIKLKSMTGLTMLETFPDGIIYSTK
ncbi:MAG: hypothetical protein Q8927_04430 [Bacteroidota bacterium]|nr:hypothetical protein [Bacteroidota bacterium]MDP4215423.1 hypothetical protein [Bacteroidota bacterium]MDP4245911.1 hypothetical protein [Bacteroidota bacterium]MDP4254832.1 hypothetical protein [Bacteroidota bacterium]MDP4256735.1 hypothetical protein [Bacteroidota bacterium]